MTYIDLRFLPASEIHAQEDWKISEYIRKSLIAHYNKDAYAPLFYNCFFSRAFVKLLLQRMLCCKQCVKFLLKYNTDNVLLQTHLKDVKMDKFVLNLNDCSLEGVCRIYIIERVFAFGI